MPALRRCLCGCGQLVTGSRCTPSRTTIRAKYKGDWPQHSRQAIQAHVLQHGWICPGYHTHPAHESHDLVLDHPTGQVMCRAINTTKRNLGDG